MPPHKSSDYKLSVVNKDMDIIKNNFISIGNSCHFKTLKDQYLKENNYDVGETSIFDYILNNLDNVINILTTNNINNLFNIENVTTCGTSNHIDLKKGGKFKSIHDIKKQRQYETPQAYYNDIELNFVKKYIRRYNRFINKLKKIKKKNNTQKIVFIYSDYDLLSNNNDINKIKKIVNILHDKFNLLQFKIINFKFNSTDIDDEKFYYKKIFDHFYVLKHNENVGKDFTSLLFKNLLEIYNI
jgi:hypothetical protein